MGAGPPFGAGFLVFATPSHLTPHLGAARLLRHERTQHMWQLFHRIDSSQNNILIVGEEQKQPLRT